MRITANGKGIATWALATVMAVGAGALAVEPASAQRMDPYERALMDEYMRGYEQGRSDERRAWEQRMQVPPREWGAWRQDGAPGRREFRAYPGAPAGNYRSGDWGAWRHDGGPQQREFRAWPGVESGNYR